MNSQAASATATSSSTDGINALESPASAQTSQKEDDLAPIAHSIGKLLAKNIKRALASYCSYEQKPTDFKLLKTLLEPFITHTGYIAGTGGFSDDFIKEVAYKLGIITEKPEDISRAEFVIYYDVVQSIIATESSRMIEKVNCDGTEADKVADILEFAKKTFEEVYEHFKIKFKNMDEQSFDTLFSMLIIKKAEEFGLLRPRGLSAGNLNVNGHKRRNDDDDEDPATVVTLAVVNNPNDYSIDVSSLTCVTAATDDALNDKDKAALVEHMYGPAPRVAGLEESNAVALTTSATTIESDRNAKLLQMIEELRANNLALENEVKDLRGRLFSIATIASK